MLQEIEEFFKAHEHTMAALEALSTFAAVVVALVLSLVSQRANRTRIKAVVSAISSCTSLSRLLTIRAT
jgi:hypothetical protein